MAYRSDMDMRAHSHIRISHVFVFSIVVCNVFSLQAYDKILKVLELENKLGVEMAMYVEKAAHRLHVLER